MVGSSRIWLIRHGQTDFNIQHRWQGHMDTPLNPAGHAEARHLAAHFRDAPFTAIYTSDLARATQTAAPLAAALGLTPIPDARLREIKLGVFEGLTSDEIEARHPDQLAGWQSADLTFTPAGGESRLDVRQRALAALADITTNGDHTDIAIITHGGTIRLLLGGMFPGDPRFTAKLPVPNTSFTRLEAAGDGGWALLELAATPHLPTAGVEIDAM